MPGFLTAALLALLTATAAAWPAADALRHPAELPAGPVHSTGPPGPAPKPNFASATGTRSALVLFARFADEPEQPLPAWAAELFDPNLPGSFSHYYDTMSFGALRVRGEAAPEHYAAAGPRSAYVASDAITYGQFAAFALEILEQADQDIDFSRYDNDAPDGEPSSGDDDGYVDAVCLVLS